MTYEDIEGLKADKKTALNIIENTKQSINKLLDKQISALEYEIEYLNKELQKILDEKPTHI